MSDSNNNQIENKPSNSSGMDPNVASCLCYLCGWITGLIFLLIEKENKTVNFHSWHSIFIDVFTFAIAMVLAFIPFLGWIISWFVYIAYLVIKILNMVKAYQGAVLTLPVVTDMAKKQAYK